jgi:hypothetical protein
MTVFVGLREAVLAAGRAMKIGPLPLKEMIVAVQLQAHVPVRLLNVVSAALKATAAGKIRQSKLKLLRVVTALIQAAEEGADREEEALACNVKVHRAVFVRLNW